MTLSIIIGLALEHPKWDLAKWLSIGAALLYGLYTLGIWLIFELFG